MRRLRSLPGRAALVAAVACGAAIAPARAITPPTREESRARPVKPGAPAPLGTAIVQWDHIIDSNDQTFEDFWGFLSYKQSHYQLWYGDFTKGAEIGGYLRDHRRSTYSAFYRYRKDFDHVLEIDTERILKKGFVAAVLLRGIHVIPDNAPDDQNMLQYGAGIDYYWGDYDFASFRVINDPRESGRWSLVGSTRLYRGPSIYVQPGLVKHTDGSTGWFVQGKFKMLRLSAGKYNQFDWTSVDRTIYSAGLEWTY